MNPSEGGKPESTKEHDQLENARVGYQAALDYAMCYGTGVWSMCNAMLMANSIVVAGIVLVLTGQTNDNVRALTAPLFVGGPIVGFLLCVIWLLMTYRGHAKATYYLLSAREIEEHCLGPQIKTLQRGGDYADGKPVYLTFTSEPVPRKMILAMSRLTSAVTTYAVSVLFALSYIGLLWTGLSR
jgi:hypothetical protein